MTVIHLENGVQVGVYGGVAVQCEGKNCTVRLLGNIASMRPPGVVHTLREALPVSVNPDEGLPGRITVICQGAKPKDVAYEQICPGQHVTWVVSEEDAEVLG